MYEQKSFWSSEQKSNSNHNNRESWSLNQVQDLSQFTNPEPLKGRGCVVVLKDLFILQTEKPRHGAIKQIALSFKENTR